MQNLFIHEVYGNVIKTGIAIMVLAFALVIVELLFVKKVDNKQQKRKLRARAFYLACFVLLFMMARIWVEGFTHLIAVLGLVSAALVITNKETIMNLSGWLIITWRGLFAEDDLIQIQQYTGYVKSLGVLYFTLSEVSEGFDGNITGRMIRIPNGLVANNPLVNLSQTHHLLEQKFTLLISKDSDLHYALNHIGETTDKTICEYYKNDKKFSIAHFKKSNKYLASRINLAAKITIKPKFDKPGGIECLVRYYCYCHDSDKLQQLIWLNLLDSIKNNKQLSLAYVE